MRDKILKMLEDADGFVSGQELCEKLGVSRTAVWKVIGALREEGYVIDSVSRRGYHLVECPDILRQEDLTAALTTRWMGRSLQVHDVTDSTNVRAKQQAEEGAPEGHLVMADMQSAGRGSRGRSWDSPRGTGIFMSLVLRPQLMPQQAAMVTLTAAYSIVSVLREDYGVAAGIKWPNDVVLNRKKLVGILTEMSAEPDLIHYIVTGIGINVNMKEFPEELSDKATSLWMETGKIYSRAELAARILNRLEPVYETYVRTGDLAFLQDSYNELLINRGQEVRVIGREAEFSGIAEGIGADGGLKIRREDGQVQTVYSGEVSVRGLYSYV
ncbi:biotin--[acetyl-CoA-carboxylase] ligase [Oscillospiraceae bacterium Marseille-Q3528]|nr:biotin--[acetyl-CoA-carboxylase] ligase [Oscillospiraceae bacterium Marseille-Q3528]